MLKILPGGFGADFASPVVGQQVQAVVAAFLFELGITIDPGDGARLPEGGEAFHPVAPAADGAIVVQFRGIGHVAIIGQFIDDDGLSLGAECDDEGGTVGPGIDAEFDGPVGREAEGFPDGIGTSPPDGMRVGGAGPVAPLVSVDPSDVIAEFPEIGDGEFFPRQELGIAVHGGLVEAIGIGLGMDTAVTDPLGEVGAPVSVVVEDLDPGFIGRRGKDGVAVADAQVLGHGGEAFDAGELIGFAVDVGIHFFPFERFRSFPAPRFEPRPVVEFEPHAAVFRAVLQGVIGLIQATFAAQGVQEVVEFRGAHIVFVPDEIDEGIGHGGKGGGPDPGPGGFPGFICPEFCDDFGPTVRARGQRAGGEGGVGQAHRTGQILRSWRSRAEDLPIGGGPPRRLVFKRDKVDRRAQVPAKFRHQPVAELWRGRPARHWTTWLSLS